MGAGLIILYVLISSISMILYFNHLTTQQKEEIKNITAANRERMLRKDTVPQVQQ